MADSEQGTGLPGWDGDGSVPSDVEEESVEIDNDTSDADGAMEAESGSWMSECATMYLTVLISSSSGDRNDTRFTAGNIGRRCFLGESVAGTGLFVRIEDRVRDSL